MKRAYLLFVVVIVAIFLLACNSAERKAETSKLSAKNSPNSVQQTTPAAPPTAPNDGVRRITTVELQELMKNGQAYVVDVRNAASFSAGHIPGAVLIPTADVLKHLNEFPRDKTIVTYCS